MSVQQTGDGGFVVGGMVFSGASTYADAWLIKTDPAGNEVWDRTIGGSGPDWCNSVQQTSDGGFIATGGTASNGSGAYDVLLMRINAYGDTVWTRTLGGEGDDEGNSVLQTADGGYIVVGYTASFGAGAWDVWLIKTNAAGDTLWCRTYGGASADYGASIVQTSDGGYVIAGYTSSFGAGAGEVWLIRTDAHGDTLWTKTFGGTGDDEGKSVRRTLDGGYIVTGCTHSYSHGAFGRQLWLLKVNEAGDTSWTRTYGGGDSRGLSVGVTQDGGFVVSGLAGGISYAYAWLLRVNSLGDTLWTRLFGGEGVSIGNSVQQTQDGGYIIVGFTDSLGAGMDDVWLIRLDSEGDAGGRLTRTAVFP